MGFTPPSGPFAEGQIINMKEQKRNNRPTRLNVGYDGFTESPDLHGLCTDLLMQNICLACQKEPLTLKQIAKSLGVDAAYLKERLQKLLYLDYIKEVEKGRYRAAFLIRDDRYAIAEAALRLELLEPVVGFYYDTVRNILPKIKALGVMGGTHSDAELLWNILPLFLSLTDGHILQKLAAENGDCLPPLRRDGSMHWVCADNGVLPSRALCPEEVYDLLRLSGGLVKTRSSGSEPGDIIALQYDFALLGAPRRFDQKELLQLKRLRQLLQNREAPDASHRTAIASLAKQGYVCAEGKTPSLLIPFLSCEQMQQVRLLLDDSARDFFDEEAVLNAYLTFSRRIADHIPDYVDPQERRHLQNRFNPECRILYLLCRKGLLQTPNRRQKKRLCTIVWEP